MNKNRKGFTIVELVIVIAIIAILAAVLIPTFASLIAKANVSADTQLVRNLNTALTTEKAGGENNKTMNDALKMAKNAGYDIDRIVSKSGNNIGWDSKNDRFVLIDANNDTYIYPTDAGSNAQKIQNAVDYFVISKTIPETAKQKYSIYLSEDATLADGTVTVSVGFDAGENTNVKTVNYTSEATQDVIIRTNSTNTVLTVSAKNSTVKHYDVVGKVSILAVDSKSYHEFGEVQGNIELADGRVVMESGSKASAVKITATTETINSGATIKVDSTAASTVAVVVPENVKTALEGKGGKIDASNVVTDSTVIENMSKFAGGLGTEDSPYLITTVDELTNINKINDTKGVFVKLANDLVISYDKLTKVQWTGYDWYTYCAVTNFNGVFDGAGYEIVLPDATNFSDGKSTAFATLIYTSYFGIIKNITLTQGTLINDAHSVTAEKIITRGTLSFENNSGMIIGNAYDKATLIDCRNEANINSTSYSAVFVGYATTKNLELAFTNCVNAGAYIGVKSSMFLGNIPSADTKVKMIVTNCGNVENGLIRTTETASSYKWNSYVSMFSNAKNINIVLNGETIDLERTLSSGFAQGPNDTLAISKNDDNTFNITKSNIDTVSYYVIKVYVYAKSINGGGTQMFAVEEKISSDNLKTTAKYLCFTTEKLAANGTICEWNVVTKNGVDYYSFNKEGYTVSDGTKPNVSIIAYDANGNVLSSATLSK